MNIDEILEKIIRKYRSMKITTIDGVKIHFDNEWVHLRKSNTEPSCQDLCREATFLPKLITWPKRHQ